MSKGYRKWKWEYFDRALPLLRAGWSVREIAERLGVAKGTVHAKLRPYLKRLTPRRDGSL